MNIKEFLENKDKLDRALSYCTDDYDSYMFLAFWETARDCPVHDGFYDEHQLSHSFNREELLESISRGLNVRHVRDLVKLRIAKAKIVDMEPIPVHYESSGHVYISIRVEGLGVYHDIGNGTKQWNDA